jgi:hypothetical protein
MKAFCSAILICVLLCFGAPAVHAQIYTPYNGSVWYYGPIWDPQYQQYLNYQNYQDWQLYLSQLRKSDPYYQLHQMHYQLHLGPYDPNRYYPTCCYVPSLSPFASQGIWAPYGSRALIR